MNIPELWAEIEAEHEWRQAEIRFFQNQIVNITSEKDQAQFRRVLILMLYAHFEGFCKFAFSLYINAVNREGITCAEVNFAIAAASLNDLFVSLRDPRKKCSEFKRELPDDTTLHRFARDREFLEQYVEFEKRRVCIPDEVIDIESNLKPIVLRKILYRLGFHYDMFNDIESNIHLLLNYRNKIAHGELKEGIPLNKYDQVKAAVYKIMDEIKTLVMNALQKKLYMRISQDNGTLANSYWLLS